MSQVVQNGAVLFSTSPGYLIGEYIAGILNCSGKPALWLRLGPEDRDPATLLLSLIDGLRRIFPQLGTRTLTQMRRCPGPLMGWPFLFSLLAQELIDASPASCRLVLDHVHTLLPAQSTLCLIGRSFLAELPPDISTILIAHEKLPPAVLPEITRVVSDNELMVDLSASRTLAENLNVDLPEEIIHKLVVLTNGRGAMIAAVCAASQFVGSAFITHKVKEAKNILQLLTSIARTYQEIAAAHENQGLALALELGYFSPDMCQALLGTQKLPVGPWVQQLADHWMRIYCCWETPLNAALWSNNHINLGALRARAAEYLARHEAVEKAIEMYLRIKDHQAAAQLATSVAGRMLDIGQWSTLENWLAQIPLDVLSDWPWLLYCQGEITAARGQKEQAQRIFARAANIFSAQGETQGVGQSLLAESALSTWAGEMDRAQYLALAANTLAHSANLTDLQGWTIWRLFLLTASSDRFDEALSYFDLAIRMIKQVAMTGTLGQVESLLLQLTELRTRQEAQCQAYQNTSRAIEALSGDLSQLLQCPGQALPDLLVEQGWSKIPLFVKLDAPECFPGSTDASPPSKLRKWLQKRPHFQPQPHPTPNIPEADDLALGVLRQFSAQSHGFQRYQSGLDLSNPAASPLSRSPHGNQEAGLPGNMLIASTSPASDTVSEQPPPSSPFQSQKDCSKVVLYASLLESFHLSINEIRLQQMPSNRGLAVFKYLLANHTRQVSRDVLMDTFWPEVGPEAARNNLNVALYSLRQALRSISQAPVIEFQHGCYSFLPDIHVCLDAEMFECKVRAGRQYETSGQLPLAIGEYENAISLYKGDFLCDDLYEEWPVLMRERLRITYLDTLDRLSQLYFNQIQYPACIDLCQRILERDSCREDAHRRLMRCFNRQGQNHLALRQYQACVEALRTEMEIAPETATIRLAERIRNQEPI